MIENHPIENLMRSTLENIRDMIDVDTIVGEPFETKDGSVIIPISKVSFGFAAGGSEFSYDKSFKDAAHDLPFGGGSGAGVSIKPIGFLVIHNDSIKMLSINEYTTYDKLIDSIPEIVDTLKNMFSKNKKEGEKE